MEHARTLGELRRTGYRPRPIKEEIRANCLRLLGEGAELFPRVVGYERTVIPEIVNAILSRHDFILLGLRGQAKTRLLRSLDHLLDEWMPVVAGSPLNEDPLRPLIAATAARIEDMAFIVQYCGAPWKNPNTVEFVDCDVVLDPTRWGT